MKTPRSVRHLENSVRPLRFYVNGTLGAQERRRGSSLAIGPGTCVLGSNDTDTEFARLVGDILTLAIFDRALSPAEIREQIRAYAAP